MKTKSSMSKKNLVTIVSKCFLPLIFCFPVAVLGQEHKFLDILDMSVITKEIILSLSSIKLKYYSLYRLGAVLMRNGKP